MAITANMTEKVRIIQRILEQKTYTEDSGVYKNTMVALSKMSLVDLKNLHLLMTFQRKEYEDYAVRVDKIVENTKEIVYPTVHINGTSAKSLYDSFENVMHCLNNAYAATKDAAPNQRDYYVTDDAAGSRFKAAREQHEMCQKKIDEVKNVYESMMGEVLKSMD